MGSPELTAAGRAAARAVRALARLVLAVAACMLVASVAPVLFGWRSYVVCSGSMAPALRVGDVVVAAPATSAGPVPGRIAVFADPGRPDRMIVHRVRRRLPDGSLVTKGDANAGADSTPVRADAVRGEVRLRLPFIGLPAYWWKTRAWLPTGGTAVILLALIRIGYPADPGPPRAQRRGVHGGRRHRAARSSARRGKGWARWAGDDSGRPVLSSPW